MIKFIIRAKKNPLKRDQVKFYPQMAPGVPVMLRTIVGRIEKRSGVSSASVKAVLDALQYEILQTLADGNSVRLGDLGSFRLTMHGEGVTTAKEAKEKGANLIKRVNVRFTKSSTMRMALDKRNLIFSAQDDIRNAKELRIRAQLSAGRKLHLTKAAFSTDESAVFSYLVENGPFFGDAGIGFGQTFTYDRKNCLR